jgi:hypothetical protein
VPTQNVAAKWPVSKGSVLAELDLLQIVVEALRPRDLHHLGRQVDAGEPAPAQKMQGLHLKPRAAARVEDRAGAERDMPQHGGGEQPWQAIAHGHEVGVVFAGPSVIGGLGLVGGVGAVDFQVQLF